MQINSCKFEQMCEYLDWIKAQMGHFKIKIAINDGTQDNRTELYIREFEKSSRFIEVIYKKIEGRNESLKINTKPYIIEIDPSDLKDDSSFLLHFAS